MTMTSGRMSLFSFIQFYKIKSAHKKADRHKQAVTLTALASRGPFSMLNEMSTCTLVAASRNLMIGT